MGVPQFTDIISLSNAEISEAIIETENQLFNFVLKKLLVKVLNHMK
jgi:hypothetical protein